MPRSRYIAAPIVAAAAAVAVISSAPADGPNEPGERYASVEWKLDGERQPTSRNVKIWWIGDGYRCQYRFHRASARETGSTVTIKVLVHYHEIPAGQACTAEAAAERRTVKLEEPLGDRKLRHAPTNDPADRTP